MPATPATCQGTSLHALPATRPLVNVAVVPTARAGGPTTSKHPGRTTRARAMPPAGSTSPVQQGVSRPCESGHACGWRQPSARRGASWRKLAIASCCCACTQAVLCVTCARVNRALRPPCCRSNLHGLGVQTTLPPALSSMDALQTLDLGFINSEEELHMACSQHPSCFIAFFRRAPIQLSVANCSGIWYRTQHLDPSRCVP